MLKDKGSDWFTVKRCASVCFNGHWTVWPPSFTEKRPEMKQQFLKLCFKLNSTKRLRTRVKLIGISPDSQGAMQPVAILAWLKDLIPMDS